MVYLEHGHSRLCDIGYLLNDNHLQMIYKTNGG